MPRCLLKSPTLTFQIASINAKLQPGCSVDAKKEPTALYQHIAPYHL